MAGARGSDNVGSEGPEGWREYFPSWVDRFTSWVDGLPGPSWAYYGGMGLLLSLFQTAVIWGVQAYAIGTIMPAQVFVAGMWPFFLALMRYLDGRAGGALANLRPTLAVGEAEYARLEYELTTLPSWPTLLASLAGVVFVVLVSEIFGKPGSIEALAGSPIGEAAIYSVYISVWCVFGAFVYHTIHQLRAISVIYARHTNVNPFRMGPLYAFSRVTAVTAMSLTATTYSWYLLNPGMMRDPVALAIALPITLLGLAVFVWPLLGVHSLLAGEKARLVDESSLRLEATLAELHERVDRGYLQGVEDLNYAIASLEIEHQALSRIPTWPWQPETVRLLATALLLPLVLLLAQVALQVLTAE